MEPRIIQGGSHTDQRGTLFYNNDFDASNIKRVYLIQNKDTDTIRGWQGHRIEQRWFSVVNGRFDIDLIKVDDWDKPSKSLDVQSFRLGLDGFDILHIPPGYISSIRAVEDNSKLLVMADHLLGEIKDEYRYDGNYFNNK